MVDGARADVKSVRGLWIAAADGHAPPADVLRATERRMR